MTDQFNFEQASGDSSRGRAAGAGRLGPLGALAQGIFLTVLLAWSPVASCADETGGFYVGDALVHYIRPENGRRDVAVVMVPGLNLSSYIFLTTPDGRTGWAQMFAADGYDVYVINDPDFDFVKGGFSVPPFTELPPDPPPSDPGSEQGWQRDIWERWGFGSSEGVPYPDARFPTDHFDAFAANYPYVGSSPDSYSGAIAALLVQAGPAWLMAHSAGGPQAVSAAKSQPQRVLGFLMIEPTNPPDADDFPDLSGMSMFGVYADYIESRNQGSRKAATENAAVLFSQNGGVGEVVSLPDDLEVHGNSHLMMQDNNNDFIAGLILEWLDPTPPDPPEVPLFVSGFEAEG
jgi:pimeloyl-ACP methyl ester carboxylesterase